MTVAGRWTLAGLAVVAALVVALALQLRQPTALTGPGDVAPDPAALAAAREHAALPPCPAGTGDIPALHGISVGARTTAAPSPSSGRWRSAPRWC